MDGLISGVPFESIDGPLIRDGGENGGMPGEDMSTLLGDSGFFYLEDNSEYDPDTSPLHHITHKYNNKYSPRSASTIRIIYLIAIVIWFLVVYWGGFYKSGIMANFILLFPVLVFGLAYHHVNNHTTDIIHRMLKGNIVSFLFLTVSLLVNWFKIGDKKKVYKAMMIAIIFIMISLVDYWIPKKDLVFLIHIKTISQTLAIVMLTYALYIRYSDNITEIIADKKAGTSTKK